MSLKVHTKRMENHRNFTSIVQPCTWVSSSSSKAYHTFGKCTGWMSFRVPNQWCQKDGMPILSWNHAKCIEVFSALWQFCCNVWSSSISQAPGFLQLVLLYLYVQVTRHCK